MARSVKVFERTIQRNSFWSSYPTDIREAREVEKDMISQGREVSLYETYDADFRVASIVVEVIDFSPAVNA